MAGKGGNTGSDTLQATLMDAAQALTRAMGTPEAANPQIAQVLGKLQTMVVGLARGGGMPSPQPQPGQPPQGGMGPAGGGAANPAMPALTGGQMPPGPPQGGASMGIPQPTPEQLRQMIGAAT